MAADKTELRGMAPIDLVSALDAISISRDMDRTALVNEVLTKFVKQVAHEMNVLHRMARGNALLSADSAEDGA
ncbi:MAG: hypothetical protein RL032_1099 [Pseudomonadota bacterium]